MDVVIIFFACSLFQHQQHRIYFKIMDHNYVIILVSITGSMHCMAAVHSHSPMDSTYLAQMHGADGKFGVFIFTHSNISTRNNFQKPDSFNKTSTKRQVFIK